MKFKGIVTLEKFVQQKDGQLVKNYSVTEENLITKLAIEDLLEGLSVFTDARKIAFSQRTDAEDFEVTQLTQINAVGDPTLIPDPRTEFLDDGIDPSSVTIKNRFLPPASTRTIESVGIVDGATLVDDPSASTTRFQYSYLRLGSPVTQQDNEIIDVSYKIFIDWTGTRFGAPQQYQRSVEWTFLGFGEDVGFNRDIDNALTFSGQLHPTIFDPVGDTLNRFKQAAGFWSDNNFGVGTSPIPFSPQNNYPPISSLPRYGSNVDYGVFFNNADADDLLDNLIGIPISGIIFGSFCDDINDAILQTDLFNTGPKPVLDPVEGYRAYPVVQTFSKASPLSNLWSHNETSTSPMYDISELANSSLKPIITESVATDVFPTEYLLKVVTAGGIGVGEYKLYKTSFRNFAQNSRQQGDSPISYYWMLEAGFESMRADNEFLIFSVHWIYEWVDTLGNYEFVTWEPKKGIAIYRVDKNGVTEIDRFPLSTYTQFVRINDIEVDPANDKIYVAGEGGLYEIVVTGAVVTQLDADACASVTVGDSGNAFAIFRDGAGSGRLSSSIGANWATALDLTGATINWDNVWRIFIDPLSTDYDLMIYEGYGPKNIITLGTDTIPVSNILKIHWWNNPSKFIQTDQFDLAGTRGSVVRDWAIHELDVLPTNNAVQVTNGVWIYPTDIYTKGYHFVNYSNDSDECWSPIQSDDRVTNHIKWDMADNNQGYRTRLANGNLSLGRGWNAASGLGQVFLGSFGRPGLDNIYALSFHATAPFFTFDFRGGVSQLIKGKPNPSATVYDLLFMGDLLQTADDVNWGFDNGASWRRCGGMFKISVDEGGVSTVKDYANDDRDNYALATSFSNTRRYREHILYGARFKVTNEKEIIWFLEPTRENIEYLDVLELEPTVNWTRTLNNWTGGIGFYSPTGDIHADLNDQWLKAYEWDGANWIDDPDNTGPGKPAHSTTDALIDGLQIRWDELQGGNPQPLVLNQYYNVVKISKEDMVLVEPNPPTIQISNTCYIRDLPLFSQSGTTPGSAPVRIYLDEAPLGSAPDSLWLSLDPHIIGSQWSATINGVAAPIFIDPSTTPAPGTIHLTDPAAGEFYFNAADSSQPYTIDGYYIRKYDSTEIL